MKSACVAFTDADECGDGSVHCAHTEGFIYRILKECIGELIM